MEVPLHTADELTPGHFAYHWYGIAVPNISEYMDVHQDDDGPLTILWQSDDGEELVEHDLGMSPENFLRLHNIVLCK